MLEIRNCYCYVYSRILVLWLANSVTAIEFFLSHTSTVIVSYRWWTQMMGKYCFAIRKKYGMGLRKMNGRAVLTHFPVNLEHTMFFSWLFFCRVSFVFPMEVYSLFAFQRRNSKGGYILIKVLFFIVENG